MSAFVRSIRPTFAAALLGLAALAGCATWQEAGSSLREAARDTGAALRPTAGGISEKGQDIYRRHDRPGEQ